MKKLILSTLLLFSVVSQAQETKILRVVCDDTETLYKNLEKEYKERPIIKGEGLQKDSGFMTLWRNLNTKTWTVVYTVGDMSCVLAAGKDLEFTKESMY